MRILNSIFSSANIVLFFALISCVREDPYGTAYVACLASDSSSVEIKDYIIKISEDAGFVIYDRSHNARDGAEAVGVNLRHVVSSDVFLMINTPDDAGVLTLHNLDLNSGELGLTIFMANIPAGNPRYVEQVLSKVRSQGELFRLPYGATRHPGICESFT
ncbi:MAG: hypothetical protein ACFE0P_11335 [Oceanicaulis sp.]